MKVDECIKSIRETKNDRLFGELYGKNQIQENKDRYVEAIEGFRKRFNREEIELFSSPGRVELGGNHTDHNNGKVLAGSISLDCIGVSSPNFSNHITIVSENYQLDFTIEIDNLSCNQEGNTIDLVKGILAGFRESGYKVEGFDAYVTSNVISAAGVSSSASFEMLLCAIVDHFFNDGKISKVEYAKIGKYAENNFWNKSSGLLDQMACAVGGIINIDFKNESYPVVKQVKVDFEQAGYKIIIVNTGKGHADLSEEYSLIPKEMGQVAAFFGKQVCAEIELKDILNHLGELRKKVSDRAILRAIHFLNENKRVDKQVESLDTGSWDKFLEYIRESGDSSWELLQNCYSVANSNEQGIPIALALTKVFLSQIGKGSCRVHGGGFAGVIMAIVPIESAEKYIQFMENCFLKHSTYPMFIRPYGSINVSKMLSL